MQRTMFIGTSLVSGDRRMSYWRDWGHDPGAEHVSLAQVGLAFVSILYTVYSCHWLLLARNSAPHNATVQYCICINII